jgi:hypothetical protein
MQPPNQHDPNIENGYRVLVIIWFAILSSAVLLMLLTFVIPRPEFLETSPMLAWILTGTGTLMALASFVPKKMFMEQAVQKQQQQLVHTGYIIAFAMSEAAGLFGLLAYFLTPGPYHYLLFVISVVFMFLHYPRRDHLRAVSFKKQG